MNGNMSDYLDEKIQEVITELVTRELGESDLKLAEVSCLCTALDRRDRTVELRTLMQIYGDVCDKETYTRALIRIQSSLDYEQALFDQYFKLHEQAKEN